MGFTQWGETLESPPAHRLRSKVRVCSSQTFCIARIRPKVVRLDLKPPVKVPQDVYGLRSTRLR